MSMGRPSLYRRGQGGGRITEILRDGEKRA